MHLFDPYGELHAQRQRELHKREMQYAAWCVFSALVLVGMLIWGGR